MTTWSSKGGHVTLFAYRLWDYRNYQPFLSIKTPLTHRSACSSSPWSVSLIGPDAGPPTRSTFTLFQSNDLVGVVSVCSSLGKSEVKEMEAQIICRVNKKILIQNVHPLYYRIAKIFFNLSKSAIGLDGRLGLSAGLFIIFYIFFSL